MLSHRFSIQGGFQKSKRLNPFLIFHWFRATEIFENWRWTQVDWEQVAQKAGYSNGACASTRFRQVKKRLGLTDDSSTSASSATPKSTTPKKPRSKKEVGSGTNKTPSKVTKKRSPKKTNKTADEDFFGNLADDDEFPKAEDKEGMDYKSIYEDNDHYHDEMSSRYDDGVAFYDANNENESIFD